MSERLGLISMDLSRHPTAFDRVIYGPDTALKIFLMMQVKRLLLIKTPLGRICRYRLIHPF